MFERFTPDARAAVAGAQAQARRLGHRFVGAEHLLLALSATETPAAAALREHGVTPERVEQEIGRLAGPEAGPGAGHGGGPDAGAWLFAGLDRDALSAIGIDLDAVRASIEASFGRAALIEAGHAVHIGSRRFRLGPRRARSALTRRLVRPRPSRRAAARATVPAASPGPWAVLAVGRCQAEAAAVGGHLPFTGFAKQSLANSLREARARHDQHIGAEHLALGLLAASGGMVPSILAALGAPAPALRAAILGRYRQAS